MPTLGTFGAAAARGFGLTTVGRRVANIVISSNTANYTLNTAKVAGYIPGKTDVTFTINSGVFVFSDSTGLYALTVDNSWTTGDTILVVNNGTIVGRGGTGGSLASLNPPTISNGFNAGPALLVQRAVSINNGSGRIAGGGGGGGSGGYSGTPGEGTGEGGAGGGGIGNGSGGSGRPNGSSGTLTSAGAGAPGSPYFQWGAGAGGTGGGYGSSGSSGQGGYQFPPGSGGAAGAAVVGNSNITWIATGTRNGSIS